MSDPSHSESPALLTVAEVAQEMRVSKMTIYRLVHDGALPSVRIGRSFRIPHEGLKHYLGRAYVANTSRSAPA